MYTDFTGHSEDEDFKRWFHRQEKKYYGDLTDKESVYALYEEWIAAGKPKVK